MKLITIQAIKFLAAGAIATLVDVQVFNMLYWVLGALIFSKVLSFIAATSIKYGINRYWTFQQRQNTTLPKAIAKVLTIDALGLLVNVSGFYVLAEMVGPQFRLSNNAWLSISIILVAIVTATLNFLAYKFIIFKRPQKTIV